jgi:PAS domain-containing protein
MKVTEAASLSEILRGRREFIARSWYEAVVCTSFVPFTEADLFNCLLDLTDQTIDTFLAEPFVPAQAQAIGTNLAELHCIAAEALGGTQEVLAIRLLADLPGDTVTRLQPRLAGLLSAIAIGFIGQTRKILLAEQEVIRQALLIQRLRAEESLRESEARFRAIFEGAAISIVLAGSVAGSSSPIRR